VKLQVVVSGGSGPDLALLHGWGLGAGIWDGVAGLLAQSFRVHRISLPGYDGSADDGAGFEQTAAAVAAAVPAGATLCGWSLGGILALAAAASNPDRLRHLVVVASTPKFVAADDWQPAQAPAVLDAFRQAVADDPAATLTRFVRLFNQGDGNARAINRALSPLLAGALPSLQVLTRGLDWLHDADLRGTLPAIRTPTLVVHGDCDPLMPAAAGKWLADTLPDARLERLAGVAHAPFVADPEGFARRLAGFCSTNRAAVTQ